MSMVSALWNECKDESWASGLRLWVDGWRDYRAAQLRRARRDPNGSHLRIVRGKKHTQEMIKRHADSYPDYAQGLANIQQHPMSALMQASQLSGIYLQNAAHAQSHLYGNTIYRPRNAFGLSSLGF